jgi:hypothetical protein
MGDASNGPSVAELGTQESNSNSSLSESKPKLDTLVVLGKGWNHIKEKRNEDPLSGRSKNIADAAARYFLANKTERMVLSGGKTAKRMPTEASALRDYILDNYPEISQDSLVLEENSIDTATNASKSKAVLKRIGANNIGLITTEDHLPRSRKFFENFNVPLVEAISAESIIPDRTPYYPPGYERYLASVRKKEAYLRVIQRIDPKGRLVYPVAFIKRKLIG